MNFLKIKNINLTKTLLGGQSFAWDIIDSDFFGQLQKEIIHIREIHNGILWQTYPETDQENLVISYLGLNQENEYQETVNLIKNKDVFIKRSISNCFGLRILNQPFEQTLLSFILSSNKNIPAIKKSISLISELFGRKVNIEGKTLFTFPDTKTISLLSEDDLKITGIGYRAKYLVQSAKNLLIDRKKSYKRDDLLNFVGVGDKVADCVAVFALGRRDITPIDLWAKRFLTHFYNLDPKMSYSQMTKWLQDYFGFNNVAIAGQFLFEYIRQYSKKA